MSTAFHFRSASALASAIRSREVSAQEVLEDHLAQIHAHNGRVNRGPIMKPHLRFLAIITLLALLAGCQGFAPAGNWPAGSWAHAGPSQEGMDADRLAEGFAFIQQKNLNLRSLVVARGGNLVLSAYFHPYQQETPVRIQSITKSVIGLLVGIAIDRGYLRSVNQPILDFFPGRLITNLDANKRAITIQHLLTMTSGLDCDDGAGSANQMMASSGWVEYILDLPMAGAPGTKFRYCSGNAHLLSVILEKASGKNTREFANEALFAPLGIPAVAETGWAVDPQGQADGSSGLYLRPDDIARLGWLYVTSGNWTGRQVVKSSWIRDSLKARADKGDGSSYGYLWTVYPGQNHAAALGIGGQQLHIYPQQNLVVVLTAGLPTYVQMPEVDQLLQEYILGSLVRAPLADGAERDARLQEAIERASIPAALVSPLPATAGRISGQFYTLEENPLGYNQIALSFENGESEAQLLIDGYPPFQIGLDQRYRANANPGSGQIYLRGRWLDEKTFQLEQMAPGELADVRSVMVFEANRLNVSIFDGIFGGLTLQIAGSLA